MEHSKEFHIQQFLQENDFEHVELNTIKTIAHLYKLLKQKQKRKNNTTKQLINNFNKFIDEHEFKNHNSISPLSEYSSPLSTHIEAERQQQHQHQQHQHQLQPLTQLNTQLSPPHLALPPLKKSENNIQDNNCTHHDAKHHKRKFKPKTEQNINIKNAC